MGVLMVQSKIKSERVSHVRAGTEKVFAALDAAQPEGIRYAGLLGSDGETIVVLLQIDDGAEDALRALPEYQELLESVGPSRAAPPVVEQFTVIGSYRLF
jgi:hypothetical protein